MWSLRVRLTPGVAPGSAKPNALDPHLLGFFSYQGVAQAIEVVNRELAKYRRWSYEQLIALVDAPKRSFEVVGASATRYYIDIYAHWDAKPNGDVRVFVDPKSFIYLHGMILDYQETLMQQGFVFVNPQATKSCGCGTSFSA